MNDKPPVNIKLIFKFLKEYWLRVLFIIAFYAAAIVCATLIADYVSDKSESLQAWFAWYWALILVYFCGFLIFRYMTRTGVRFAKWFFKENQNDSD